MTIATGCSRNWLEARYVQVCEANHYELRILDSHEGSNPVNPSSPYRSLLTFGKFSGELWTGDLRAD
jgi:hypothetical protein